jgi:transposase-like protein
MGRRIFTEEQIAELLKNKNIRTCSPKAVSYAREFKVWAVKQYNEQGLTATAIFEVAGFDLQLLGKNAPQYSLSEWRKVYATKGVKGLELENRGKAKGSRKGRPKTKGLTDQDKILRLEAHVAYLKAENDFLAKLRAQRRE